jgi:hypothetical protein
VEARAFSEDPAALASVLTCIRNCIKVRAFTLLILGDRPFRATREEGDY